MKDVSANDDDTVVEGGALNIDLGASATGLAVTSETPDGRRAHVLIEIRHRGSRQKQAGAKAVTQAQPSLKTSQLPAALRQPQKTHGLARPVAAQQARQHRDLRRAPADALPLRHIRVETAVFDTQLMENAETAGIRYQQGDLLRRQFRSYVFHRDGRRCPYCRNDKAARYELNHIVPKSVSLLMHISPNQ